MKCKNNLANQTQAPKMTKSSNKLKIRMRLFLYFAFPLRAKALLHIRFLPQFPCDNVTVA